MKKLSSLVALGTCLAGCSTSVPNDGEDPRSGGASSAAATGGAFGSSGGGDSLGSGGTSSAGGGASSTGGNTATGGSAPSGGAPGTGGSDGGGGGAVIEPVDCEEAFLDPNDYNGGLPLLQSNPNAGLVLFVDFDGGNYGGDEPLGPYYTGSSAQRQNIVRSFNYLTQYFAMFDLSITTDATKIGPNSQAAAWGWLVVSPDISGGSGKYNGIGRFTGSANAKCGSSTMTSNDRSRRIAHEFGHNLNLYHNGLYENGNFCKFEDCSGWDGQYGSIMGGGGEGERNGWALALYDDGRGGSDNQSNKQDSMAKIRSAVRELGGSTINDGWAKDDHPDNAAAPFCRGDAGSLTRVAVLGSPDDVDVFEFTWKGGAIDISWQAPGVSAALLDLTLTQNGAPVGDENTANLAAGNYELEVRSQGAYGAIGYYEVGIR